MFEEIRQSQWKLVQSVGEGSRQRMLLFATVSFLILPLGAPKSDFFFILQSDFKEIVQWEINSLINTLYLVYLTGTQTMSTDFIRALCTGKTVPYLAS